jgi:hypothetical protein
LIRSDDGSSYVAADDVGGDARVMGPVGLEELQKIDGFLLSSAPIEACGDGGSSSSSSAADVALALLQKQQEERSYGELQDLFLDLHGMLG